ncbi:ATP-binding protein [Brevundimonas sp.]|uniref:ATP-binding protein n=1 Tax=Brevundimonas sp. TaxID=1871086 RepID=UPI0028A94566|nr:ATP-binding protein [Brevundimonas sp.]
MAGNPQAPVRPKLGLKADRDATGAPSSAADPLAPQYAYVAQQQTRGGDLGVIFVDAFIRGIREIGYKNPAWALAELVDNSFQAGAKVVDIRFEGADLSKERSKPAQIAIVDDGIGMIPGMLSHAVRWGGTHRENDRDGFGRYGYGLPSAAVSLARRYSVYSKIRSGTWQVVTVDLDQLAGAAARGESINALLQAKASKLPEWIRDGGKIAAGDLESGTVVVLEDLDRLHKQGGWVSAKSLQIKLLQHFGVIYRHWLKDKQIYVAGDRTGIIDPLFLLPGARYADETTVRAKPVKTSAFEMDGSGGPGIVRIRASVLPPNFQLADPAQYGVKGAATNARFGIMKAYNGILVCRAGRQIDVVMPEWTKFQNYDQNLKIEIDFDPALDEFFGLTTSKQQIVIDDRMWEKLKQTGKASGGLQDLVKDMRNDLAGMRPKLVLPQPSPSAVPRPRPSGAAMQAAQKFKTRSSAPSPQKVAQAQIEFDEYVETRSRETGATREEAQATAEREVASRPFDVEFVARDEAPLYQARRLGQQKRLLINTAHPFYQKVYELAGAAKPGLEVFLFVLADAELDAEGDRESFYRAERSYWSESMRHALEELLSDEELNNQASAEEEQAGA